MNPNSLLNWMLLSTGLLSAWWLCYCLALRQERSFAYNRVYLVLGPLLAAGLPLLPAGWFSNWGVGPAGLPGMASVMLPAVAIGAEGAAVAKTQPLAWLALAYAAGVLAVLARLGFGLCQLWLSTRRLTRESRPGYTLVPTRGQLPTSSFGCTVFWDETLALSPAEAAQVLRHELAHARQGHTYDRLLLELLRAALWFNPFVHLCGRALALTHEYLADAEALRHTDASAPALSPVQSYAHLLARQVATRLGFSAPLAHTFSHSQTLRRIAMIQKTNPIRRWKQWLVLPLFAVFFVAVSCEKATTSAEPIAPSISQNTVAPPPPPPVVYETADPMPELAGGGGAEAIVRTIQQRLDYPNVARAERKDGRMFVSFIVTEKGEVQAVKVLKSLGPAYDAAAIAVIQQLPAFVPGRKDGKPVAVSFTVPIQFVWKSRVRVSGAIPINWQGWAVESPGTGAGC